MIRFSQFQLTLLQFETNDIKFLDLHHIMYEYKQLFLRQINTMQP